MTKALSRSLTKQAPKPLSLKQVIYVRASEEEKRTIGKKAFERSLSISRYLALIGTEGKAPPTQEERERLEQFLLLLKRAHAHLKRLSVFWKLAHAPEGKTPMVTEHKKALLENESLHSLSLHSLTGSLGLRAQMEGHLEGELSDAVFALNALIKEVQKRL